MKLKEQERNIKQVIFRLHNNDHAKFKSKCAVDGLKMQSVIESLIFAYLDGNEYVKEIVKQHKMLNTVNKKQTSWSKREADNLLEEIESIEKNLED